MNAQPAEKFPDSAHAAPDGSLRWMARILMMVAAGLLALALLLFSQPAMARHTGPGDAPASVALRTAS